MDPHLETIHDAAWRGDLAEVRALVDAGVSPSAPYAAFLGSSETPLLLAAENGHLAVIDFLVGECGVDVDREQDADGARALHYACYGRATAAVAHLLARHRADPMVWNRDTGETPLMVAAAHGPASSVQVLLADGRTDMEAARRGRKGGQTAILLAAKGKQWAAVGMLLDHGADPTVVWRGRAAFLKRTLLDFARTDPLCPPPLLARIEAAVAEGQRAELVHRLRFLSDAGAASASGAAAAAASSSTAAATAPVTPAVRETRGTAAARLVRCVPECLAGRVRGGRRRPMPVVELSQDVTTTEKKKDGGHGGGGMTASKKKKRRVQLEGKESADEEDASAQGGASSEEKEEERRRRRLRAVAAHVVLGGLLREHWKELLEMLAPPFLHAREARRGAGR